MATDWKLIPLLRLLDSFVHCNQKDNFNNINLDAMLNTVQWLLTTLKLTDSAPNATHLQTEALMFTNDSGDNSTV